MVFFFFFKYDRNNDLFPLYTIAIFYVDFFYRAIPENDIAVRYRPYRFLWKFYPCLVPIKQYCMPARNPSKIKSHRYHEKPTVDIQFPDLLPNRRRHDASVISGPVAPTPWLFNWIVSYGFVVFRGSRSPMKQNIILLAFLLLVMTQLKTIE